METSDLNEFFIKLGLEDCSESLKDKVKGIFYIYAYDIIYGDGEIEYGVNATRGNITKAWKVGDEVEYQIDNFRFQERQ